MNVATVDLDPLTNGIQTSFTNAQGTFAVNSSGLVTYTPALNFNGTVVRTYVINDNLGLSSAPGTYTITVVPVNDPPVANDDSGSTFLNTAITYLASPEMTLMWTAPLTLQPLILTRQLREFSQRLLLPQVTGRSTLGGCYVYTYPGVFGNAAVTYRVQDNLAAVSNVPP